jgi:catalase
VLVADGCDDVPLRQLVATLTAEGAVPRFVGLRLGQVETASGEALDVDVPVEAAPSVLFDAAVLPSGAAAVERLVSDGRVLEFVKDQYRHCKPILVLGQSAGLLKKAGIPEQLPNGPDPGLLLRDGADGSASDAFIAAIAKHRHFERETDPPRV